jgi:CCR4-NOT transcriptional regulation complex NOT5 subunit
VGPASYPKSQPDVISAPGLFRKMDPEALFFAFYYQPDTYQQYLAAQVRCWCEVMLCCNVHEQLPDLWP